MKIFDLIVVGAGPAGSTTAHVVAQYGFSVALIDKYIFPRDKLCGGLLTYRCKKTYDTVFSKNWDSIVEANADGVKVFQRNKQLAELNQYKSLWFTRRFNFDHFLVQQAVERGAHTIFGHEVKTIDLDKNEITLDNGEQLQSKCIVGADGVNSLVSRHLFKKSFDKKSTAFGLEVELPLDTVERIAQPEIFFGYVNWGYGWIFPKRDTLTVGVGGLYGRNEDFKKSFRELIEQRFGNITVPKLKGHYIPFGNYAPQPGRNNVLLCGDAAGLVEPITGEGIAFALQSGRDAGNAIVAALREKQAQQAYRHYYPAYRSMVDDLRHANRLRYLLFPKISNRIFGKLLSKHPGALKLQLDLMSADISYSNFSKSLFSQMTRVVVNRFHSKRR